MYLIRRAVLEDGLAIHEAHLRSIREVCGPHYSEAEILAWGYRTYSPSKWSHSILNDFVLVVESNQIIMGYGHARLADNNQAQILGLYLCPEILGLGVGKAIFTRLKEDLVATHVKTIHLESTLNALSFYKKLGFVQCGEQTEVLIGNTKIRCFRMELQCKQK